MIGKQIGSTASYILIFMIMTAYGYGQAPLGINYQGIARNMDGSPKSEKAISIRVSILDGGVAGIVEYAEIHTVITNQFGLFSLVIGQGENAGSIQDVEWSTGDKWLQIEMDDKGGNAFEVIGAQQIFSVPYAMYASQSGTGVEAGDGIGVEEGVITNTAPDQPITLLGVGNVEVSGNYPDYIVTGTDNVDDADNDPVNELQAISQTGTSVSLSKDGGTISVEDSDADPANEIQDASQVSVTPGGKLTSSDVQTALVELQGEIDLDNDQDPANEIQDLTTEVSGNDRNITISGGTGTTINVADLDNDPVNEIQNLSQIGSEVTLSNGGGTVIIDDTDADPSNEVNTGGSYEANNTIRITDSGGEINIPVGTLNTNLNADGNSIINLTDPSNNQDAATKNYVDIIDTGDLDKDPGNEVNTNGNFVSNNTVRITDSGGDIDIPVGTLNADLDANSNRISNLSNPLDGQDAVTKSVLDATEASLLNQISTNYAFSVDFDYLNEFGDNHTDFPVQIISESFDQFMVINSNSFTVSEDGIYLLTVSGVATSSDFPLKIRVIPGDVYFVKRQAAFGGFDINYYDTVLLDLISGQIVDLVVDSNTTGDNVSGRLFGYKL